MKMRIKLALLALSLGGVALSTGACLARALGDAVADQVLLSLR